MSKGFHKKPSKRLQVKRRHKIEKKVREHNKKLKKAMKKRKVSRKSKDPGIPSSLPFKEKILNEVQEQKQRNTELREKFKNQAKKAREEKREQIKSSNRNSDLKSFVQNAEKLNDAFVEENSVESLTDEHKSFSNLKSFYKNVQKLIDSSDVIIEVVDARDPLGTRCFEIEDLIVKTYSEKRVILLINKCDLIPKENLIKWLDYLRKFFVTIPFKASTQNQKQNLCSSKSKIVNISHDQLESKKCFGADILMKLLNNYCRNKNLKTSITVGVVGFPNVGKSSIINSLKRNQVCLSGPTPGLTQANQFVSLDKNIKLIDSPGIVFSKSNHSISSLSLLNAIKIDSLPDPITSIEVLLNRINRENLMNFYRLTEFETVKDFLSLVAKRFGKLLKGGILDLNEAAKKVLQDWNSGKLKYFTLPPDETDLNIDIKFVQQMSKEFDINEYSNQEIMNIDFDEQADYFLAH